MSTAPSLRHERSLIRAGHATVACLDEVGRGALCGPVTIGAVLVSESSRTAPQGVRDSKLLTAEQRWRLVPRIERWAVAWGVGHASPAEIDRHGMTAALRLAAHRALDALGVVPAVVLLDGNHDYVTPPEQEGLFGPPTVLSEVPPVRTRIKADMTCAGVAAASVLAKTARDAIMAELARSHPEYGWDENKGYSAPAHVAALGTYGPTPVHRLSWKLPGIAPTGSIPAAGSIAPADPIAADPTVQVADAPATRAG